MSPRIEQLKEAAAQAPQQQEKQSVLSRFVEQVKENHPNQPNLGAGVMGAFRGGREDLWNSLIPAFPDSAKATREPGAPGSPTPQLITQDLTGDQVDTKTEQSISKQKDFDLDR